MIDEKFVEWNPTLTKEDEVEVEFALGYLKARISALRTLRKELGLSQAEISEILETTQSNVSKMEAKDETRFSIIRRIVEHKGGRLRLLAEFEGRELELPI